MKWGELKELAEREGVKDDTEIAELILYEGDTLDSVESTLDAEGWSVA